MENLVKLRVLGISRSQVQNGAFALLLEQDGTSLRIPIVVGAPEAQAIALRLEGIVPPRPITHDLFTSIFHAFGIVTERVVIAEFEQGVFKARIDLSGPDGTSFGLDARASDAVAIALRTGAPLYTTEHIATLTGFTPDDFAPPTRPSSQQPLHALTTARLQERLAYHVEREEYEQAAEIQKIIAARQQEQGGD